MKKTEFSCPTKIRFVCLKCGICCGDTVKKQRHVLLLQSEAEAIAEFAGEEVSEFADKVEGKTPYVFEMKKTNKSGQCFFLRDNECTIYSKRPMICRFYPFELRPSESGLFEFHLTNECPGIGKGELLSESYFRSLFRLACRKIDARQRHS